MARGRVEVAEMVPQILLDTSSRQRHLKEHTADHYHHRDPIQHVSNDRYRTDIPRLRGPWELCNFPSYQVKPRYETDGVGI